MYMYIKLCIFVYIVYIVMTPVIVFDLSRVDKFIINNHETSIYIYIYIYAAHTLHCVICN